MKLKNLGIIEKTESRNNPEEVKKLKGVVAKGKGPLNLDTEERTASRIDHLFNSVFEPFDVAKERVMGRNDLMSINYLQIGYLASYPVCRIHVRNENGGNEGYGTGFLISPSLLITNNHVLENKDSAAESLAEFNYQYDVNGMPADSYLFELQPGVFFTTNEELDYTIVAVKQKSGNDDKDLADFGFLKLYEESGKALISENLSIIQHPAGGYKQIAIRENQLLDVTGDFVTYNTDTSQGSSGAVVCNDQWQVVALHHSGIPRKDAKGNWLCKDGTIWQQTMDESLIDWVSNEGIRISSIIRDLKTTHGDNDLITEMISITPKLPAYDGSEKARQSTDNIVVRKPENKVQQTSFKNNVEQNSMSFTIPIEVNIKIGTNNVVAINQNSPLANTNVPAIDEGLFEVKKSIEPNYKGRNGYSADFVKSGSFQIELEDLVSSQLNKLAPILNPTRDNKFCLHYFNFSVIINKRRRLCALTAVNIDGKKSRALGRENNPWIIDPRMDERFQTGPTVYASNDLDRGHMVRRLDPVWGGNAEAANDDTFHFTNSTPQHKNLNQKTWLSLEDHILNSAKKEDFKVSVFTGPVFGDDDIPYRGTLLPMQFWKVAAMIKEDGEPSVTGYLLSQPDEIDKFRTLEGISEDGFGAFRTYQVPLQKIADLTGLNFDRYEEFDPMQGVDTNERAKHIEISGSADIRL